MSNATAAIRGIRRAAKARDRADAAKAKATEELWGYCEGRTGGRGTGHSDRFGGRSFPSGR